MTPHNEAETLREAYQEPKDTPFGPKAQQWLETKLLQDPGSSAFHEFIGEAWRKVASALDVLALLMALDESLKVLGVS